MSLFFVFVANSGIFVEYGADFATAASKKYMQKVTKFIGGMDFLSTFVPLPILHTTYLGGTFAYRN